MTDYSNWKILKSELDEKQDQYSKIADWCNESGQYHIESVGEYYAVVENPAPVPPTYEEIRQMREKAYEKDVDTITSHIQRLRDKEQTEEVKAEIAELMAERDIKVAEIKERYPYPEGEGNESA